MNCQRPYIECNQQGFSIFRLYMENKDQQQTLLNIQNLNLPFFLVNIIDLILFTIYEKKAALMYRTLVPHYVAPFYLTISETMTRHHLYSYYTSIEEIFVGSLLQTRYKIIQKTKEYGSRFNKYLPLQSLYSRGRRDIIHVKFF